MSFFTEVAILFQGMSWIVWLALILGYVFILIEFFQPGFGIFGVIGVAIIALGIVLRVSVGDGNIFAQIFCILFLESVLTLIAFLVLAKTAKNGWVRRSPLVENAVVECAVTDEDQDANSSEDVLVGDGETMDAVSTENEEVKADNAEN